MAVARIPMLTDAQRAVLETIYRAFLESGDWPRFGWLDDELDQRDVRLKEALETMPDDLYWPDWRPGGVVYYGDEQQLGLRVAGLAVCSGSGPHLEMLLAVVSWLVESRDQTRPATPQDVVEVVKRPADLIEPLKSVIGGDPPLIDLKLIVELMHVEPGLPSWSGDPNDVLARTFPIQREIRRFRGVESVEQLLAVLAPKLATPTAGVPVSDAPLVVSEHAHGAPAAADGVPPARAPRRRRRFRHGHDERFGRWALKSQLGSGGNAEVWRAVDEETGEAVALKILHADRTDVASYARFRREVSAVRELAAEGARVLPIVDEWLPETPTDSDPAWFAMPEATPIADQLARADFGQRVAAFAEIADELAHLAEREWHHRDLKPANLYYHKGRFVVGDFGLIKRPEDDDLTRDRTPGPYQYMPNEAVMGEQIDQAAFDLFCLAKSMWVVLTNSKRPPQGQIPAGSYFSLSTQFALEPNIDVLDQIVHTATSDDPRGRGTFATFATALSDWVAARAEPAAGTPGVEPAQGAPAAPTPAVVGPVEAPNEGHALERTVVDLLKSKNEVGLRELMRDERRRLDQYVRTGVKERHGSATYGDVTEFWRGAEPSFERVLATTLPLLTYRSVLWDDQLRWFARFSDVRLMESGLVIWIEMSRWFGWLFANTVGAYALADDNLAAVRTLLTPAGPAATDDGLPLGLLRPGEAGVAIGTGMMAELAEGTRYYVPHHEYALRYLGGIAWLKERYGEFAADAETLRRAFDDFNFLATLAAAVADRQHIATWTMSGGGATEIARRIRSSDSYRAEIAAAVGATPEQLRADGNALLDRATLAPAGYRNSGAEL